MQGNRIEIELEPHDRDNGSKISVSFDSDMVRVRLKDCDNGITWRFRGPKAINKIERIRVMLDIIEEEIKKRGAASKPVIKTT